MKSFLRVALPIFLVAGLVFGITFIRSYTTDEQDLGGGQVKEAGKSAEQALKFFTLRAVASTPDATPKHLRYWESEIEVNASGHFEFLCQNRHPRPVSVRVPMTNCQCAGAELAVVPPDAYRDFLVTSALADSPLCPAPGPVGVLAHV